MTAYEGVGEWGGELRMVTQEMVTVNSRHVIFSSPHFMLTEHLVRFIYHDINLHFVAVQN